MKLQGLSVIFCLIAVPIILVLTAYIQAQITTISMQLAYDTKLLDATHDAMVALEINTANEDLSTVSDSLRSIVSASTNTFINSLSTNMGMSSASKGALQPYVPAILVTLYDGYYIYSPTKIPVVCTDSKGVAVYVGDKGVQKNGTKGAYNAYTYTEGSNHESIEDLGTDYGMLMYKVKGENKYITGIVEGVTEFKTDYVLKSYIPYASRYKTSNIDVQINYTLDNFINIYGMIDGVYYTKSGYYSDVQVIECSIPNLVRNAGSGKYVINYSETAIDEYIDSYAIPGNSIGIKIKVKYKIDNTVYNDEIKITTQYIDKNGDGVITDDEKDDADSAIRYYLKSHAFSDWVRTNLADLEIGHIQENMSKANEDAYGKSIIGGNDNFVVDSSSIVRFEGDTRKLFSLNEDPEILDSTFSLHRTDVMKNSIQYNLNIAMSSYNEMELNSFEFEMPILDDITWYDITSKVSVVSFMQGFKCGLKTYNNYASVSSTNNEFTVIPEEIYYVGPDASGVNGLNDETTKYHRIDCPEFSNKYESATSPKGVLETICIDDQVDNHLLESKVSSFVSKEVKYDKIYDSLEQKYNYDHKNVACYKCIVSRNYKSTRDGEVGYYNNLDYKTLSKQAKKVYLIGLAKQREDLYKTNQIVLTQGMKTDNTGFTVNTNDYTINDLTTFFSNDCILKNIKSIEITFTDVKSTESALASIAYICTYVNDYLIENPAEGDGFHRLIVNQAAAQTITLDFTNSTSTGIYTDENALKKLTIKLCSEPDLAQRPVNGSITYKIDSIKVNYK